MKLLAIDPAINCVGWAVLEDNYLHGCGVLRQEKGNLLRSAYEIKDKLLLIEDCPDYLVIEKPHISINRPADPNDLINVALVAGVCLTIGRMKGAWLPTPQEWKGSTPKLICHHRMFNKLTETEKFVIEECLKSVPKSLCHNAYDAAALGLKYLERLGFRNG